MRWMLLLLAAGCTSTGPDEDQVPANGIYDYTMDANLGGVPLQFTGDLVIRDASTTDLNYRWYVPGYVSSEAGAAATYDLGGRWNMGATLPGGRFAEHIVARSGDSYQCSVRVNDFGQPAVTGTCSLSYSRPDTVRTIPAPPAPLQSDSPAR